MILTRKPLVHRVGDRWRVVVWTTDTMYIEHWRTHTSAMNCALAIARTSICRPEDTP